MHRNQAGRLPPRPTAAPLRRKQRQARRRAVRCRCAIQPTDLAWKERLRRLVQLTGGLDMPDLPYFDLAMLRLESIIAEPKHHRRVFEEFSAKWVKAIEACSDLPRKPEPDVVEILFVSVWGAKRYLMLLERDQTFIRRWMDETTDYACMRIAAAAENQLSHS